MRPERVNILLSTFNSVNYLRIQLDSLIAQRYDNFGVIIRDDGSADSTNLILHEYLERYPHLIRVIWGQHIGAIASFLQLLRECETDCDYVAFCDHDDVWLPDKVTRAVGILNILPLAQPNLYCGRRICVDEQLKEVGLSKLPRVIGYENALVENIAAGCTMMLNRSARDMINSVVPQKLKMYDWWCYLVVSAFGQVYYDPQPLMLYRQHRGNLKGDTPLWHKQMWERLMRVLQHRRGAYGISDQVAEFMQLYGAVLAKDKRDIANAFLAARDRLSTRIIYALRNPLRRQTTIDQILLTLLILIGGY